MCGIVGIFNKETGYVNEKILASMNEAQFHRGPDEGGIYLKEGIGLGHRRLSILDLESGKQPMLDETKSTVIVFNGEIYNYKELTADLIKCGYVFRTNSDTEVILNAWREWGKDCVNKLRGMFAFAIFDKNKHSLFLARDRLGKKPLYYTLLNNELIFASELKAIMKHPHVKTIINLQAVEDYFAYGFVPEPKSIYQNIFKLKPGHYLYIDRARFGLVESEYWDVEFHKGTNVISEDTACEELIDRLTEATKIRMIADVPIGAFLSGGVDSSSVVALMSGISKQHINTCSISFDDEKYNEEKYAAEIAGRYKTNHFVEKVDSTYCDDIEKLIDIYDEPFADDSAIPTLALCGMARKHVTVALSGDGADEILAGYRRYNVHLQKERIKKYVPDFIRKTIIKNIGKIYPKLDWAPKYLRMKATLETLAMNSGESFLYSLLMLSQDERRKIFSRDFNNNMNGYNARSIFYEYANKNNTNNPLLLAQYVDMKLFLPGDILTKVDRASMAHSLEVRSPMLDHVFTEWAVNLPNDLKIKYGQGKYILKKTMEPYVPKHILYRRKMGFDLPIAEWLRGALSARLKGIGLTSALAMSGYFNMNYIQHMIDTHISGQRNFSTILWSLLVFNAFLEKKM